MGNERSTRDRLLDATVTVSTRDGMGRVTLDAVAAEAGVSKGGLLYHFASKDALLRGLIDRYRERLERDVEERAAADPDPGAWSRGYLHAGLLPPGEHDDHAAVMAAIAIEPSLLAALDEHLVRWQARFEDDGLDPAVATVVRLAADGLWLADLVGLAPPGRELRSRVLGVLEDLTRTGTQQP